MSLLTTTNPKLLKGEEYGYKSFGLHLSPFTLSGRNLCPNASAGCAAACLNSSGYGRYSKVQEARLRKSKFFNENREEFMKDLIREVNAKVKTSKKTEAKLSFRLNLTSDVVWESIKYQGKNIMEHFPEVQFMDYTKNPKRMMNFIEGKFPSNYHLTFSRSESNQMTTEIIMGCGGNVAVVFHKRLPKTYRGKKVINGVAHDLRFLDPKGVVVGLVALGDGKKDKSGFIVNPKTGK
jgi:hypothetical protein